MGPPAPWLAGDAAQPPAEHGGVQRLLGLHARGSSWAALSVTQNLCLLALLQS